jgi:LysM repeat protein/ABC-type branched-subunit amino acid transport system substrate-binding protein
MKKLFRVQLDIAFLLICLIPVSAFAQFQSTPVDVSRQKAVYQGKVYYLHNVKQGHTLHAIAKAYSVSVDAIKNANKEVVLDPLKVGKVIRIPVDEMAGKNAIPDDQPGENSFIYHTVQEKETPYFLHKKYKVPLEAIYYYNPGTDKGLKTGQVIRLPQQGLVQGQKFDAVPDKQDKINYEVKQGDTLYRIAKDHNVTIADLIYANEILRFGLKAGQILVIPTSVESPAREYATDSIILISGMTGLTKMQCDSVLVSRKQHPPIKVAVLLPFFLKESLLADTITSPADSLSPDQLNIIDKAQKGKGAAEFYEGFLLGVDSLRKTNIDMSLFVYDTEGDMNKVKRILGDLDIVEPDIIIGPFIADNVELVSNYSFERKITMIPPLIMSDTLVKQNPFLFQTTPTPAVELRQYARYLSQFHDKNLILVYKRDPKTLSEVNIFKQSLISHLRFQSQYDSLNFSEVFINDTLKRNLNKVLQKHSDNYVIVFSTYEPDVINVLTHLHFSSREIPIRIFGLPDWQVFPNIRIDHIHDLETVLYSPFHIDYTAPHVKAFVHNSRLKLGYEPYKTSSTGSGMNYSYLGYDIAFHFLKSNYLYGDELCNCIEHFSPELLMSQYHFGRNSENGSFENTSINIIQYNKKYDIKNMGIVGD